MQKNYYIHWQYLIAYEPVQQKKEIKLNKQLTSTVTRGRRNGPSHAFLHDLSKRYEFTWNIHDTDQLWAEAAGLLFGNVDKPVPVSGLAGSSLACRTNSSGDMWEPWQAQTILIWLALNR